MVGSRLLTDYLRETAPTYIYSNPITVGEAAAARRSLAILDSPQGRELLAHLRAMTSRFERASSPSATRPSPATTRSSR